jgi:flagellar biogenesis protein FliO
LSLARDRPARRKLMRMGISLGGLILLILIIWLLFFRT